MQGKSKNHWTQFQGRRNSMDNLDGFKKAKYRGIPCYYNEETEELGGRNWFYDILVSINIFLDYEIFLLDELPIWIDVDEK